MTHSPVEVDQRNEQRTRGGDGALSFAVVCASPSLTPTVRVHQHCAIPRLLSRRAPSLWSTHTSTTF